MSRKRERLRLHKLNQDGTSIPIRSRFYERETERIPLSQRTIGRDVDYTHREPAHTSHYLFAFMFLFCVIVIGLFLYALMWAGMHLGHFFGMACQP